MNRVKIFAAIALTLLVWVGLWVSARVPKVRAARAEWRRLAAVRRAYEAEERAERTLGV